MSAWPSSKASRVLAALLGIGYRIVRTKGSHRTLQHADGRELVFAFHDSDEIGPKMLARIGKASGLTPKDL